jgi:hypothetical protein
MSVPLLPQSPLERFPEYVKAIGTTTIELCNLEAALCHLFGAIVRFDEPLAGSIFFSPKTTAGRLDMVLNLTAQAVKQKALSQDDAKIIKALVARADKLLRKRNDVVHEMWGVSRDFTKVMRIPPPYGEPRPVTLESLTRNIADLRILCTELDKLSHGLRLRSLQHYHIDITYSFGAQTSD